MCVTHILCSLPHLAQYIDACYFAIVTMSTVGQWSHAKIDHYVESGWLLTNENRKGPPLARAAQVGRKSHMGEDGRFW
jgi:hypothetical protein